MSRRGDVYLVSLDPTVGSEIKKTRPVVVVSPDEMNGGLNTVIVAPLTTGGRAYPSRVACRFGGKQGWIALDQIRSIDASRLKKRLGSMHDSTLRMALTVLREIFTS